MLQARLLSAFALLFSIVPYLRVPIVLRPSHSLLLVYEGKHLYDKYLNNEIYENKVINSDAKAYLSSILWCTYGYLMLRDLCYVLLREIWILLYVNYFKCRL